MSHELRTPLNAIIGYSEILMEDAIASDGGRSVPDLKKVHAAGKHLLSLINDILDLTKIEAGKMDLYEEWFDVGHLLKNIAETIQPLVLQNQNRLTIDCPTDVGNMYADSTKIRQTLVNLLNNACKFTQRGDVHVKVWREAKDENEQIFFSVQDSGIGMSREQQDKLFEAFSQADASATRKFGGTGLGLVISQHYCNMMGGHIHVASELGQGATFTVSLPLKKGPSQENVQTIPDELAASWQAEAVASEVRYSPMPQSDNVERREHLSTVLVIDDDPSVHDIMTHYLTQKGFNVHTASSGAEGLEQAADIKPDVITLDVMMPGMDGWAVLKALKQDPELCDIPVIMVSMVENRNMGFSLGAIDYLSKPIEKERLCDVVNRCVRSSREGTVLVVEDNDALRTSIKDILALDGWTVKAVQSAESAFSTMGENPPVLIMLDLMMPEMDGFEFLNQLQHNPRWSDIPVVVISGKQLSVEEHRQLQGRVAKVVNKAAYHHDELLDKVYHIVNKSLGSGKKVMSEFDETVFLD
jgi:CheY-like chemotaxis protein